MDTMSESSDKFDSWVFLLVWGAMLCVCYFFITLFRNSMGKYQNKTDLPPLFVMFWPAILLFADFVKSFQSKVQTRKRENDEKLLQGSGFAIKLHELYGAQLLFASLGFILGGVLLFFLLVFQQKALGSAFVFFFVILTLVIVITFYLMPREIIKDCAKQRRILILSQLPFAIDLITSAMIAGLDFQAAVNYLVESSEENELLKAFKRMQMDLENTGCTRIKALQLMDKRLAIPEFSRFVSALTFGMQSGAPIINILLIQSDELRRIKYEIAEKEAATASERMGAPKFFLIFGSILILIIGRIYIYMHNLDSTFLKIFK